MARVIGGRSHTPSPGLSQGPDTAGQVVPFWNEPRGVDRFHVSRNVGSQYATKIRNLMLEEGNLMSRLGTDMMGSEAQSTVMQIVDFIRKGRKKVTIRFCIRHIEIFQYNSGGWISIPVALTGGEEDFFAYTGWADKLLFSNGIDGLWELDFTTQIIKKVPDAPSAKHLTTFGNRVVASHVVIDGEDFPLRVAWTAKNDYKRWAESTTAVPLGPDLAGGHEDLYGSPEGVTDEAMGVFPYSDSQAWLVRSRSTWMMSVSGNVLAPFRFDRVFAFVGTPFRHSIVSIPSGIIFGSRDNFHQITTDGHKLIGDLIFDEIEDEVGTLDKSYASYDPRRQEYRIAVREHETDLKLTGHVWRYRLIEQGWTADEYPWEIKSLSRQIEGVVGIPIDTLIGIIDELPLNYPPGPIDKIVGDRAHDNMMMFVPESSNITFRETDDPRDVLSTGEQTDSEILIESGIVNLNPLKAIQHLESHFEYECESDQRLIFEYTQIDGVDNVDGLEGNAWIPLSQRDIERTEGSEIVFIKQEKVSRKLRLRVRSPELGTLRILGLASILVLVERPMAPKKPRPASISILPSTLNLTVGGTQQLSWQVLGTNGQPITGVSITFISSNSSVATVSSSGLVRAIAPGSFSIVASVRNVQTSVSGVVVAAAPAPVMTVVVTPSISQGVVGTTQQFTATLFDAQGSVLIGRQVTWASSNTAIATVNAFGLVTLVAAGTAAISATSEGVTGGATLTVTAAAATVTTVAVIPASFSREEGETIQLVAQPMDIDDNILSGKVVTWSTSSAAVATVNATGLVTMVSAGSVTITATCETINGTSVGTVTAAPVAVASVSISPISFSVAAGATQTLTATARDVNNNVLTGRPMLWSSNNNSVATVSQAGVVTGVAAGSATITVVCEGKSAVSTATVTPVAVASVTVSPATFSINAGATITLVATPKDSGGNALTGRLVTWGSSDVTKATVSSSGVVTGVAAGSVTITATCEAKLGTSAGTVSAMAFSPVSANSGVVYSPEPNPAGSIAELPRVFLDSRYNRGGTAPVFVSTVTLTNAGSRSTNKANLQQAIDQAAARSGNSRIRLPNIFPGAEVVLKKHAFAGSRTFIEAVAPPTAEFTRCTPTSMTDWPEIRAMTGGANAVSCAAGADGYRFVGIMFTAEPKNVASVIFDLIKIESGNGDILGDVPTDIWFDRCLVRGNDAATGVDNCNVRNGVTMNGTRSGVVDSWVDQICYLGFESHAIISYNTPGPLKFVNNYCSASSICFFLGGAIPKLGAAAGRPTDIEIRHHHHSRPMQWAKNAPEWDGVNGRGIKNLLETKNCVRLLIEGCIFEKNWADGQSGMALIIKSGTGTGGTALGCGSEHVTIRHNIIRNSVRCWNFASLSDETDAIPAHAVTMFNNLAYDIGTFAGQTEGRAWLLTQGFHDLFIKHNTLVHNEFTAGIFNLDLPNEAQRFVFTDNLTTTGNPDLGVFMTGGAIGTAAIQAWTADPYVWERNVLIGLLPARVAQHPAGTNQFATDVAAVGFVDASSDNYKLAVGSSFKGDAEGGTDPGADIDKVNLATSGVDFVVPPGAISINPGTTIQTVVNANPAGSVYLLKAGTHLNQSVIPKNGDTFIGEAGTVMDGQNTTVYAFNGLSGSTWINDVTIQNLTIRRYNPPAQFGAIRGGSHDANASTGWTIDTVEVKESSNFGIRIGHSMHVIGCNLHHNKALNIGGVGNNVVVENTEIAYGNDAFTNNPGFEAGGTKFVKTDNLLVRNCHVHHNGGPGLWMDINNINYVIEDNHVEFNAREGIVTEISAGGIIRNNTVHNNGTGDPFRPNGYLWNAGIAVHASRDVEIYGNAVNDNFNGIVAIQQNRGAANGDPAEAYGPYIVINLNVHDNSIKQNLPQDAGMRNVAAGAAQDLGDNSIFTSRNNHFTNNTYFLQNSTFKAFDWQNATRTIPQWQGYGHDTTGTFNF